MGKVRGFLLKHRVKTLFRYVFRQHRSPMGYHRLGPHPFYRSKPISRLINWTHNLSTKAKAVCRSYTQIRQDLVVGGPPAAAAVPKGHMAVYVGQKDGDFQRVLVPVIYFNHPLFGQLLRESEEEFGYNHPGAITIPCRISEFELVQTRIKQGRASRKLLTWKRQT